MHIEEEISLGVYGRSIIDTMDKNAQLRYQQQKQELEQIDKQNHDAADRKQEMDFTLSTLKVDVNNFLLSRLPPNTTLDEFENFAVELNDKIRDLWEKQ